MSGIEQADGVTESGEFSMHRGMRGQSYGQEKTVVFITPHEILETESSMFERPVAVRYKNGKKVVILSGRVDLYQKPDDSDLLKVVEEEIGVPLGEVSFVILVNKHSTLLVEEFALAVPAERVTWALCRCASDTGMSDIIQRVSAVAPSSSMRNLVRIRSCQGASEFGQFVQRFLKEGRMPIQY